MARQPLAATGGSCATRPCLFAAWPGRNRQAGPGRTLDGQFAVASVRPCRALVANASRACCSRPAVIPTTTSWSRKKPTRQSRSTRCATRSVSWCRPRNWVGASSVDRAGRVDEHQRCQRLAQALEEPSGDTVLLLVSHQPSRLLPTIKSRWCSKPVRCRARR